MNGTAQERELTLPDGTRVTAPPAVAATLEALLAQHKRYRQAITEALPILDSGRVALAADRLRGALSL